MTDAPENGADAPPVTLAEAVAQVEAWRDTEGMPLTGLHRIAQVLHGALEGTRLYRDTLREMLEAARDESARLTAEVERLTAERDRLART